MFDYLLTYNSSLKLWDDHVVISSQDSRNRKTLESSAFLVDLPMILKVAPFHNLHYNPSLQSAQC